MKCQLLSHTPNPEWLLTEAYSQCYQKPASIKTVKAHFEHTSVLEHIQFTFALKISRVAWDQLVRHRHASPTCQSHRYTDIEEEDCYWYIPDEIVDMGILAVDEWIADAQIEYDIYRKWRDRGVTKQTARYLIPHGVGIKLVWTINLRSLVNFFQLRLDRSAQEEIRKLACKVYHAVIPTIPHLKDVLDALIMEDCHPVEGTNPMVGDDPIAKVRFINADLQEGESVIIEKGQAVIVEELDAPSGCCRGDGDCAACDCQHEDDDEEPVE